jgi:hypothetical protein
MIHQQVFGGQLSPDLPPAKRVIILEEDLKIASDFFEFFAAVTPMIDHDTSLLGKCKWAADWRAGGC